MKVLWIINLPLPEASNLLNERQSPFGGWLVNLSKLVSCKEGIELHIAFPKSGIKNIRRLQGNRITYYAFPEINFKSSEIKNDYFRQIIQNLNPDIVNIFGTEYPHSYRIVKLCNEEKIPVVVTIQGLISVIAKHYFSFLPPKVLYRSTFRNLIKQDNILQQEKQYLKRGEFEIKALKGIDYVIGRTTWDKACTNQINPNLRYYHCNEILRDEFYNRSWDISTCEKYSIFVSQGSYPIKGLHLMLESLKIIIKQYPQTKLYIGGNDITKSNTIKEKLKITSYGIYIKDLINKYGLKNNVVFTGILNERQMCERYLQSHVFVCPSTIENSPNSLGEAMLLGVPCIASNVGGVTDLLDHKKEGFVYPSDAPYMLAHYVSDIFKDNDLALRFSNNAKSRAEKTHDKELNTNKLVEIYENILNDFIN